LARLETPSLPLLFLLFFKIKILTSKNFNFL
jgi:hypothetical protein